MFRFIVIFSVVFINATLFAQAPDTMWTKTFGNSGVVDRGRSVQQTTDGGYIVCGTKLIKTDENGNLIWSKNIGGNSVQQTNDGGYILTGYTKSVAQGWPGDVWLIKIDVNGDTLWTKTFGDSGLFDCGYSVQQTTDSGFIITGITDQDPGVSNYRTGGKVWLLKTDADGDTMWTNTYRLSSGYYENDRGHSVQQSTDSGFIITGAAAITYGEVAENRWTYLLLIKTDVNGDTLWTRILGPEYSTGNSVCKTNDGGYIITGRTVTSDGVDIWLVKTNEDGDTLWTKTFGDTNYWDEGHSVQQTSDGGYIVCGSKLIKTDENGNLIWSKNIGGNSVQQTADGGYIVAGNKGNNIWLIKIAPEVTSIDENPHATVNGYHLKQNYPNPFNPTTNIEFSIPKAEFVTLKVYNILGEEVATLVSEKLNAGKHKYDWPARSSGGDANSLASGVYLYRIQAGDYMESKKMILLR